MKNKFKVGDIVLVIGQSKPLWSGLSSLFIGENVEIIEVNKGKIPTYKCIWTEDGCSKINFEAKDLELLYRPPVIREINQKEFLKLWNEDMSKICKICDKSFGQHVGKNCPNRSSNFSIEVES